MSSLVNEFSFFVFCLLAQMAYLRDGWWGGGLGFGVGVS